MVEVSLEDAEMIASDAPRFVTTRPNVSVLQSVLTANTPAPGCRMKSCTVHEGSMRADSV